MVVNLVNLVLAILVNLVSVVHLVHLANWILDIWSSWICFTIQKTRKYFIETKVFTKIPMVFKNLFQCVREKGQIKKN